MVLYTIALLRPVQPLLEYYIRYDYFANELCLNRDRPASNCNGQCILMQRLKQASEQQQPAAPISSAGVNLKDYPVGFMTAIEIDQKYFLYYSINCSDQQKQFPSDVTREIFHPPA